jgi:hypothetical protein
VEPIVVGAGVIVVEVITIAGFLHEEVDFVDKRAS